MATAGVGAIIIIDDNARRGFVGSKRQQRAAPARHAASTGSVMTCLVIPLVGLLLMATPAAAVLCAAGTYFTTSCVA